MLSVDWLKNNLDLERFARFAFVGALGTILDVGLLMLLSAVAQLATLPANLLSYSAGIVNNYVWNRRWTFSGSRAKAWVPQFVQFAVVSLIGLTLNSLMVIWLEEPFGLLVAKLSATGVVLVWNYNANRLWTFGGTAEIEVM